MRGLVILALLGVALAFPEAFQKTRRDQPEADESIKEDIQEAFDCKRRGETCWGVPKCCGFDICTKGLIGKGTCQACIAANQKCHADWQCCEGTQCDKSAVLHANGACKPKRAVGADCFENSQCPQWCERGRFAIWGHCV